MVTMTTRKEAVSKDETLYEIAAITFTMFSPEDILRYAEIKIMNKELYKPLTNLPMPFGVLDNRLGPNKSSTLCETCGSSFQDCAGHWGYIKLNQPVFHVGYFKHLINLLYCICKRCSKLLMPEDCKSNFLRRIRLCKDPIVKRVLLRIIVARCKRESHCLDLECNAPQGVLRKVMKPSLDQFMKIILQKKLNSKEFKTSKTQYINEDLDARYIQQLLKNISPIDCEILDVGMPDKFLISSLLVPPKCIRPSVTLGDSGTNEDDLTVVFSEIVDLNNTIAAQSAAGLQTSSILNNMEFLQLQCTRFINSKLPPIAPLLAAKNISSPGWGICQRLKGKEGRFRGNLSGKRVDFSARTVISPDMNCPIFDVVVPEWAAKRLTFPERVSRTSIEMLKNAVLKGDIWPGAAFIIKKDGSRISLKYANCRRAATNLEIGDVVERHLYDGDIVLFNRQPSLHRLSIMAHRARVRPWRTFRFNECVCSPYNADFDGDEMNCHLPQTQEARAEAYHLMGVVNNLVTPKNGEPLIAATQDFLCGAYCLTSRDSFFTRDKFSLICCYFCDANMHIELPPPTILKPLELWTGKQIINVMLRPNKSFGNVIVTFELKEREFTKPPNNEPPFMCPKDGYVIFNKSELICGAIAKTTLGGGSKKGLFFHLIRDNSNRIAADCMTRLAKLTGRWLSNKGVTIGIDDVTPSAVLKQAKINLINKGLTDVQNEIMLYQKGMMNPHPGCTLEQTLETRIKCILDDLRTVGGKAAQDNLPVYNKPLIMFLSGAKGSLINIAQMIALVGQQNVSGARIQNGFVHRTLPHFHYKSQTGKSRGFVEHSFFDGLEPEEFFFHTMSGREGLVDTAVKTAETGYMQRRLVKALEDLSSAYDCTVRTSDHQVVQFVYGDDGLNPAVMEDQNKPMHFDKVYTHVTRLSSIFPRKKLDVSHTELDLPTISHTSDNYQITYTDMGNTHSQENTLLLTSKKNEGNYNNRVTYEDNSIQLKGTDTVEATDTTHQQFNKSSKKLYSVILPPSRKIEAAIDYYIMKDLMQKPINKESQSINNEHYEAIKKRMPCISDIPATIQQKLFVLKSLGREHSTYNHVKYSIIFYLITAHWLNETQRKAPLLPYEIIEWGKYFCKQCDVCLPLPLRLHQEVCLQESQTHQEATAEVYTITRDLSNWINNKAHDVANYRERVGQQRADTESSYNDSIQFYQNIISSNQTSSSDALSNINTCYFRPAKFPENSYLRRGYVIEYDYLDSNEPLEKESLESNDGKFQTSSSANRHIRINKQYKFNQHYWVTVQHLFDFFQLVVKKYTSALIEPSEAVGAIGAQSIGEPGTQMTLKTFHFAGVASMNVTLGVPRIKEIINAATTIMTPIIQVPLNVDNDINYALVVKSRIEQTLLHEVLTYIQEVYSPEEAYLLLELNFQVIKECFLDITAESVVQSILKAPSLSTAYTKSKDLIIRVISPCQITVTPPCHNSVYFDIQFLKQKLQTVHVAGLKSIKRGVVKVEESKSGQKTYALAVEGCGLLDVMGTVGVKGNSCISNNIMEIKNILGIEAARRIIIEEIQTCMNAYSMDIDCRHMQLLGDVMTFRGDVLGISRFGIQKMRASTLLLASFEETNEHLFEAAAHNRKDVIRGVSESIIMGKLISLGTGSFDILHNYKKTSPYQINKNTSSLLLAKYAAMSSSNTDIK